MKAAQFLTISLLLFAFTSNLPLSFSRKGYDQVRDSRGKPIFPGGTFYIKPILDILHGGGLKVAKTSNSTCPVTVLQDFSEGVVGLKVRFIIPGISPGIIFEGTPIDIVFDEKPGCVTSSKWVVVGDDFPGKWIGIGNATQDHPGKQIITGSGNFNILQAEFGSYGYYFVFCSKVTVPSTCYNITRHDDKNGRRLILTKGDPYQVVFVDSTI